MNKERNAFKAGLFILVTIALAVGVIIAIKGLGTLFEPNVRRTVSFKLTDDLGGLSSGDEVRVGGVKVGSVERIEYQPAKDNHEPLLVVDFTLPKRFTLLDGAQVLVQTSVTGASNLNLTSLGEGQPLATDAVLVGRPSGLSELFALAPELKALAPTFKETLANASAAVAGFKETGPAATAFVKSVQGKVEPAMDKYNKLADSGTKALDEVASLFGDTKPDFRGTMKNLNASTGDIKEKLPGILDSMGGTLTKVQATLDNATAAMVDIRQAAADTKEVTGAARTIVVGNRGKIDNMIAAMKSAGDNLKAATSEIRRSPWRLLYKPAANEVDNLLLFDSAREFADGASNLNDAVQSLRDAISAGNVPDAELQKKVESLDRAFEKFGTVEQKLWKSVKD